MDSQLRIKDSRPVAQKIAQASDPQTFIELVEAAARIAWQPDDARRIVEAVADNKHLPEDIGGDLRARLCRAMNKLNIMLPQLEAA